MTIDDFFVELDEFVESRDFLQHDDGDPDEYRKGYRAGYYDALQYILGWVEELADAEEG